MTPDVIRCVVCQTPVTADQYIVLGSKRVPVCDEHKEQKIREASQGMETSFGTGDPLDWEV